MYKQLFVLLFCSHIYSCSSKGETGYFPENSLSISMNKSQDGISKLEFNSVLDKLSKIYSPIFNRRKRDFQIIRSWKNGMVNAYAVENGTISLIRMYGGLARHRESTSDSFALVACHEIGHHLGGAPKEESIYGSTWATSEGQSDYFAALKCFRKFVQEDDNLDFNSQYFIPSKIKKVCNNSYTNSVDEAICIRTTMAAMALARIQSDLLGDVFVSIDTPSEDIVSVNYNGHPEPQCRLDTALQGALCNIDQNISVDSKDPLIGTCNRSQGDILGVRPLCWYHPEI